jgi:hypothetical protein
MWILLRYNIALPTRLIIRHRRVFLRRGGGEVHRHLKVALAVLALAANLSHPSLARADNQSEIAKGDGGCDGAAACLDRREELHGDPAKSVGDAASTGYHPTL